MTRFLRFSVKQALLLIAVVALVFGAIIVPNYRRYADDEYLFKHPAVVCKGFEVRPATGVFYLLGIQNIYENLDDLEITLSEGMPTTEFDRLLRIVDQRDSVKKLWIQGETHSQEIDLSQHFKDHDFQSVGISSCLLSVAELPIKIREAETLKLLGCDLEFKKSVFQCKHHLSIEICDVLNTGYVPTIHAASMNLDFDNVNCESMNFQIEGGSAYGICFSRMPTTLKSVRITGTAKYLRFFGVTNLLEPEFSPLTLDVSELNCEETEIFRTQCEVYRDSIILNLPFKLLGSHLSIYFPRP